MTAATKRGQRLLKRAVPRRLRAFWRRRVMDVRDLWGWSSRRTGVNPRVARQIARLRGLFGHRTASAAARATRAGQPKTIPYVVWAPPYDPSTGGPKVMHWFVNELNRLGYEAYAAWIPRSVRVNPLWDEPTDYPDDFIAVYPDTQYGNPLGAARVARWALNVPGRLPMIAQHGRGILPLPLGSDWGDEPTDLIFPFARGYNVWGLPEERILYVPIQEVDDYEDRGLPRSGRMFYVGKGADTPRIPETEGLPELDKETTHDRKRLAGTLNRIELLYTYDTQTGITDIARLCGCPVVLIPNDHTTREDVYGAESGADGLGWGVEETEKAIATVDARAIRAHIEQLMRDFYEIKLPCFIRLTQQL